MAAASDCSQKRARSPQPGTSLFTRHFLVTSKTLSTVLEGATRPGARVVAGRERVAGTAAVARKRGHATPGSTSSSAASAALTDAAAVACQSLHDTAVAGNPTVHVVSSCTK
eukprot:359707-Chlamydomonas_euryale.AAC.1